MELINQLNEDLQRYKNQGQINPQEVSDGHHTFEELYAHRDMLFIVLCSMAQSLAKTYADDTVAWRSRLHSDGSMYTGYFILGLSESPGHQITYHLPLALWDYCDFADTIDKAKDYDGHSPADVLDRLNKIIINYS